MVILSPNLNDETRGALARFDPGFVVFGVSFSYERFIYLALQAVSIQAAATANSLTLTVFSKKASVTQLHLVCHGYRLPSQLGVPAAYFASNYKCLRRPSGGCSPRGRRLGEKHPQPPAIASFIVIASRVRFARTSVRRGDEALPRRAGGAALDPPKPRYGRIKISKP